MNKGILIGGVIIVAGGLVTPYFFGNAIESRFDQQVKDIQLALGQTDPSLRLDKIDYKKGWFSSTANTVLTVNHQPIFIDHKITHGPWGYFGLGKVESQLVFNDQQQQLINSLFDGKQPLLVTTKVGFSGNRSIDLYSAPIDNKPSPLDSATVINWGGMTGNLNINGNHLTGDIKIPSFLLSNSRTNKKIEITNFTITSEGGYTNDIDKLATINWASNSALNIEKVLVNDREETYATKVALTSGSSDDNTNVGFDFNLKLTDIVLPQHINMSIDSDLVEFGIGFNGLPKQPLVEFLKKVDEIQRDGRIPTDSELMQFGQNFAIAYLQGTPSVTAHALLTSKQGDISVNAEAKLATPDTSTNELMTLAMGGMARLHVTLEPSFSESLVDVAVNEGQLPISKDQFIMGITEKNRFILNNGKFSGKFEFKQGQFYSNGQPDAELQSNLTYMLPRGIF